MTERVCFAHNVKEWTHVSKEQIRQAFFTQPWIELAQAVDATERGLFNSEAEKRLRIWAHNELEEREKRSILLIFIVQFGFVVIIISCGSTILSVVTSGGRYRRCHYHPSCGYHQRAAFGFYQEGKARSSIESLKSMSSPVARSSWWTHGRDCDSKELVPGDIVPWSRLRGTIADTFARSLYS